MSDETLEIKIEPPEFSAWERVATNRFVNRLRRALVDGSLCDQAIEIKRASPGLTDIGCLLEALKELTVEPEK